MDKIKFLRTSVVIGFMAIFHIPFVTGDADARCCGCGFEYGSDKFSVVCGSDEPLNQEECRAYCFKRGQSRHYNERQGLFDWRDCRFNGFTPCES